MFSIPVNIKVTGVNDETPYMYVLRAFVIIIVLKERLIKPLPLLHYTDANAHSDSQ